jgi:hypothetical protein
MGSNTEKKPWTDLQNSYKNWSKEIKSDNFCYRKVGRAITKWGAIEKSPILILQHWKNYHVKRVTKLFRILMVGIIFSSTVNDEHIQWKYVLYWVNGINYRHIIFHIYITLLLYLLLILLELKILYSFLFTIIF